MKLWIVALLLALSALSTLQAQAKEAVPLAQDEATEKRLVDISAELRCLVCQNVPGDIAGNLSMKVWLQNALRKRVIPTHSLNV